MKDHGNVLNSEHMVCTALQRSVVCCLKEGAKERFQDEVRYMIWICVNVWEMIKNCHDKISILEIIV